jgi:hypothetical protein
MISCLKVFISIKIQMLQLNDICRKKNFNKWVIVKNCNYTKCLDQIASVKDESVEEFKEFLNRQSWMSTTAFINKKRKNNLKSKRLCNVDRESMKREKKLSDYLRITRWTTILQVFLVSRKSLHALFIFRVSCTFLLLNRSTCYSLLAISLKKHNIHNRFIFFFMLYGSWTMTKIVVKSY